MEVVEREHIPSYSFRPKEGIILVRAKGETYFSWARVVKMPSQAIVTGLTSCQFVVPNSGPPDNLPEGDHHLHEVHHPWPGVCRTWS